MKIRAPGRKFIANGFAFLLQHDHVPINLNRCMRRSYVSTSDKRHF